jgi:hypothetical protein
MLSLLLLFAIAAPQVRGSILGIQIGSDIREVRRILGEEASGDRDAEEEERGKKFAWMLKDTEYKSIALKVDDRGKVVWVTGFVRPGREIPFSKFGSASQATRYTDAEAIWNVPTDGGGYRLVAKGMKGKARVVYLLSLAP